MSRFTTYACVRKGCDNIASRQCIECENRYCPDHMSEKYDVCNSCIMRGNY